MQWELRGLVNQRAVTWTCLSQLHTAGLHWMVYEVICKYDMDKTPHHSSKLCNTTAAITHFLLGAGTMHTQTVSDKHQHTSMEAASCCSRYRLPEHAVTTRCRTWLGTVYVGPTQAMHACTTAEYVLEGLATECSPAFVRANVLDKFILLSAAVNHKDLY